MAKVTPIFLTSIFTAEGLDAINSNFTALANEFETVVSRDGQSPSALTASLDANSQKIINLGTPVNNADAATKQYVDTKAGGGLQNFPLLAPDGTVAAPSYAFDDATSSGMFRDVDDGSVVITSQSREVVAFRPTGEVSLAQDDNGTTLEEAVRIIPTTDQVNRIEMRGSTTGNDPNLKLVGDDANLSLVVRTKGTGTLKVALNDGPEDDVVLTGDLVDESIVAAASATNYTPAASHVQGHLAGIDTAIGLIVAGGTTWGNIAGTLSNQTDLQAALDAKAATAALLDENIVAAGSATNYTPAAATVEGHLSGIDTALGSTGAVWGNVTGTLSNQTDLQAALDAKAATAALLDENIVAAASASNYTPAAAHVQGHLAGIDTAIGAIVAGGTTWGNIVGTLSNQTDLQAALDAKAATSHTHTVSQLSDGGDWIAKPNKRELVSGVTSRPITQSELDEGKVLFAPTSSGSVTITIPDTLTVDVSSVYVFHVIKPDAANSISFSVGAGFTDRTGGLTLTDQDSIMEIQVSRGTGSTVTVRAGKGRYGV